MRGGEGEVRELGGGPLSERGDSDRGRDQMSRGGQRPVRGLEAEGTCRGGGLPCVCKSL